MSDDKKITTVNMDRDLYEWLNENNYNVSGYTNESIRMRKENEAAMEELLREREIQRLENEIASNQAQIERLKEEREKTNEWGEVKLSEARDALANIPKEADNPAVKNWANKLNMTPQELLEEL